MSDQLRKITTYRALEESGATLVNSYEMNQSYAYANWVNSDAEVNYQQNTAHTLTLYAAGGHDTSRVDSTSTYGYQGAICLLPENSDSCWNVRGEINLRHFYFTDKAFRRHLVRTHDIEPSSIELPELTFTGSGSFRKTVHQLFHTMPDHVTAADNSADAIATHTHMQKEVAIVNFFEALYSEHSCLRSAPSYRGGLSPAANRKIKSYIHEHVSENITLKALSDQIGLSEFHLQRMFKLSNGITPHDYLMEVRVDKVKQLLGKQPLLQLALDCGFSHQSHMNRVFKKQVGVTPLQYLESSGSTRR